MGASAASKTMIERHAQAPLAECGRRTAPYGISAFEAPLDAYSALQRVFLELEEAEQKSSMFSRLPCCASNVVNVDDYSFVVTESSVTSDISWYWPKNAETLSLFRPLFEAALRGGLSVAPPFAAEPLQLWTAAIIVRRSRSLPDATAEFHTDYGCEGVPPGFAFSILTPLMELVEGTGGLECQPWARPYDPASESDKPMRVPYRLGQLVAVDGKCCHRTEPYNVEALAGETDNFVRAVVSLDVHPRAPAAMAEACRKSVRTQHDGNVYVVQNPWDEAGWDSDELAEDTAYG